MTLWSTPKNSIEEYTRRRHSPIQWALTWALVAILVIGSIALRAPRTTNLYVNQDATWHVLHTMDCYDGIDAEEHLFLPLVTPDDDARGIGWGATVPDKSGIFYYTAFWPAGFAVPYFFAKLFGLAHVPGTLYIFNSLLYAGSALLACLTFARLFRRRLHPCLVVCLAAAIYLLQPEILQSQGAVYWHHSLNQLLLIAQLYCFSRFGERGGKIGFFALGFLTPFVEWSGIVANVGYALVLLFVGAPGDHKRPLLHRFGFAAGLGLATAASLGITLAHYLQRLSFSQLWQAMAYNYTAQGNASLDPLIQLLAMYFRSFRFLWMVLGLLLASVLLLKKARSALPGMLKIFWPYLFVTLFPMLENLLLRQQAVEYSYVRMKGIYPLLLVFFMLLCCLWRHFESTAERRGAAAAALALVLVAGASGLAQYLQVPNRYVEFFPYETQNRLFADAVLDYCPREDSLYGLNLPVRGYTNHLFAGGVVEQVDEEALVAEAKALGKHYAVHITAQWGTSNTYAFAQARIIDVETGAVTHIFAGTQ